MTDYDSFSSIPNYNRFRFTADTVDRNDLIALAVKMPRDFRFWFVGAFSVMLDIDGWQSANGVTSETMVEIANNDVIFAEFCEFVVDCITNNDETIEAIREAIAENGLLPPSSESTPDGAIGADESVLVTGCNFDEIYGQAVAIEDYIAQVAQDLIEVVSNAPGAAAAIARVIDTVPVLGDLPVADDLNDIITWLQVQGQSTFDAGYTTTLRQDNICAMFEKACANCELTMRDILDVYVGGGNISYAFNDPLRVLVEVVVGNVAPTAFVYGVMAFVTGALSTGGEIFGLIGLRGLQTIAATGDPDSDWSTLCNPCPGAWVENVDFEVDQFGAYITQIDNTYPATWSSGVGWEGGQDSLGARDGIVITLPSARTITRIRCTIDQTLTATNTRATGFDVFAGATKVLDESNTSQATGLVQFDSGVVNLSGVTSIELRTGSRDGASSSSIIKSVIIEGDGTNPF